MQTKHIVRTVVLSLLIVYLIAGIVKTLIYNKPKDFASTAPIAGSLALIAESAWLIYYQIMGF